MKYLSLSLVLFLMPLSASAADRTVTFSIPGMTCALCPVTVSTAMGNVEGVISTTTDLGQKTATAIYDDTKTTEAKIAEASANAGYPASVVSDQ